MTWTLRLYDASDVEIAVVTADPYDWTVTHPNSGWDDLKHSLRHLADGYEMGIRETTYDGWRFHDQIATNRSETPKDHLEYVQENVLGADGVESTTLKDE